MVEQSSLVYWSKEYTIYVKKNNLRWPKYAEKIRNENLVNELVLLITSSDFLDVPWELYIGTPSLQPSDTLSKLWFDESIKVHFPLLSRE